MASAEPFTPIKIRVAAALCNGDEVALIHRAKNGRDQYTLPGGNGAVPPGPARRTRRSHRTARRSPGPPAAPGRHRLPLALTRR